MWCCRGCVPLWPPSFWASYCIPSFGPFRPRGGYSFPALLVPGASLCPIVPLILHALMQIVPLKSSLHLNPFACTSHFLLGPRLRGWVACDHVLQDIYFLPATFSPQRKWKFLLNKHSRQLISCLGPARCPGAGQCPHFFSGLLYNSAGRSSEPLVPSSAVSLGQSCHLRFSVP